MLDTHRQCMIPVTARNTNPVTLISYSFVCLGYHRDCDTDIFTDADVKCFRTHA